MGFKIELDPVKAALNSLIAKLLPAPLKTLLSHLGPAVLKFVKTINWTKVGTDFITNYATDHDAAKDALEALAPVIVQAEAEVVKEHPELAAIEASVEKAVGK